MTAKWEEFEKSNALFRLLVESVGDYAIFVLDAGGVIRTWNRGAERLNGYRASEIIGRHFSVFYTPEDVARAHPQQELELAREQGRYEEEGWRVRKDGTRFWSNVVITRLLDTDGDVLGYAKVTRDLTAKKQAEDQLERRVAERTLELERTLNNLRELVDVSRAISAELELERLVQTVTDAATRLSGAQFGAFFYNVIDAKGEAYTLYTISGAPREAFSKFPMPRNSAVFEPTFRGQGTVRSDDIQKDPRYGRNSPYHGMPPGHLPVRSYLAVPVTSRGGMVLGGLFFGHSDTGVFSEREQTLVESMAAQAAVAIDNARLLKSTQDAVRVRDEFLSIASHELKTPLTSLKLQTQLRQRLVARGELQAFTPEKLSEMLARDDKQIVRLGRLIDDMLDISRLRVGKLPLVLEDFDLVECVGEVVERLREDFKAAGCAATTGSEGPVPVRMDRHRVEQLLLNLLTNAMKYGAGQPISVRVRAAGDRAQVIVADQGMGIDKADQERIFKQFERAVSPNQVSGLGLGLFISQQIAHSHGGEIRVESEVGQGATFTLELPRATIVA